MYIVVTIKEGCSAQNVLLFIMMLHLPRGLRISRTSPSMHLVSETRRCVCDHPFCVYKTSFLSMTLPTGLSGRKDI